MKKFQKQNIRTNYYSPQPDTNCWNFCLSCTFQLIIFINFILNRVTKIFLVKILFPSLFTKMNLVKSYRFSCTKVFYAKRYWSSLRNVKTKPPKTNFHGWSVIVKRPSSQLKKFRNQFCIPVITLGIFLTLNFNFKSNAIFHYEISFFRFLYWAELVLFKKSDWNTCLWKIFIE